MDRYFYLSMFEICSEKGKSEKIFDLSQDRTDLCSQQTSIKGVQEVSHFTALFFCCNFTAFSNTKQSHFCFDVLL